VQYFFLAQILAAGHLLLPGRPSDMRFRAWPKGAECQILDAAVISNFAGEQSENRLWTRERLQCWKSGFSAGEWNFSATTAIAAAKRVPLTKADGEQISK
jgi:hypothetical protein